MYSIEWQLLKPSSHFITLTETVWLYLFEIPTTGAKKMGPVGQMGLD